MNPAQRSTLRKAAVWMATLLVVLQCGWLAISGVLTLASIPNSAFLPFDGLDEEPAVTIVVMSTLIAGCQVLAVWRRSTILSSIVGVIFVAFGTLGFGCGCLVWLLETTIGHDLNTLLAIAIFAFFVATWLFIGVVMMSHAIDPGKTS